MQEFPAFWVFNILCLVLIIKGVQQLKLILNYDLLTINIVFNGTFKEHDYAIIKEVSKTELRSFVCAN